MSTSGSDYEPDQGELDLDEDHQIGGRWRAPAAGGGRRRAPSRPRTRSSAAAGEEVASPSEEEGEGQYAGPGDESGYTTGGYTTGDDEDEVGNMFTGALDPLALLQDMEDAGGPGEKAGGVGLQPFQVLRKQRRAAAAAARRAEDDSQEDEEEGGREEELTRRCVVVEKQLEKVEKRLCRPINPAPRPPPSAPRDAPASRPRRPSASGGGGGGAFGADFDEIIDEEDLVEELWGVEGGGRGRGGGRGSRRGGRGGRSRSKRRKRGKGANQLSEEALAQVADANMLYTNGKYTEAAEVLLKVIKVAPNLADPYHTMGLLHEAMGNSRKALDFHMIAAHLTPKDVGRWKRLAALSTEVGYLRQAIYCLSKAVAHSPGRMEPDARWDRALMHAELGESGKAIRQMEQVAALRPWDPEVPTQLARLYHKQGLDSKAIAVLENVVENQPDVMNMTHVNILAELYMHTGAFEETHSLVTRVAEALATGMQEGGDDNMDEGLLPMELVAKNGMCLAHLGRSSESEDALAPLRAAGPEVYADLYSDVGVALAAMGQYAQARQYLEGLLELPEFGSDPTLWGRLLLCYRALGDITAAVELYTRKLDLMNRDDPGYMDAAITLCELWVEAGDTDKAAQLLRSIQEQHASLRSREVTPMPIDEAGAAAAGAAAPRSPPLAPALLMRKNKLHLLLGQRQEFIAAVLPMVQEALANLASDSAAVSNPQLPPDIQRAIQRRRMLEKRGIVPSHARGGDDGSLFPGRRNRDRRRAHVRKADEDAEAKLAAMSAGEDSDGELLLAAVGGGGGKSRSSAVRTMFTDDDGLSTFTTLCRSLLASGQVSEAQELASRAVQLCNSAARWFPRARRDLLSLLLADVHCAAGDGKAALKAVRGVLSRWPASCQAWSRLSHLGNTFTGLSSTRSWTSIILAARRKQPTSIPAMIMQGHVYSMSRQHEDALGEFFQAYRFWSHEPLLLLCIGVAFISHAVTKRCDDRNKAVLQGFAFLQMYEQQRGNLHESSYNIGRAAHQLGLLNLAQHYYERALAAAPVEASPATSSASAADAGGDEAPADLSCEIAHNLALIYQASGAPQLARELYLKHLTVT